MSALSVSPLRSFVLLTLLASAIYLAGLGASGIHRTQEGRVAEVAREMRDTGEWIVPHLNGTVRVNKPPLPYWAVLGVYSLFGGVSELAVRLPSALSAIGGVLLAAALGARLYGNRAGLLGGAVLATTQIYVVQGRRGEADVPMALFVILSMYAFDRAYREGHRAWKPLFFAAMGLAFMTKGVPGVAVPLLAAIIWLVWEGRAREAAGPGFLAGLVLAALIAAPWYTAVWSVFPDAAEVFRSETMGRLGQDAPHANPFYYYFLRTPLHLLPWILVLPVLWRALRAEDSARRASRLPVAWLLGGLVFLTLLQGKQPHYLVPIAPAFAILAGGGLDRAIAGGRPAWVTERAAWLFAALVALTAILFAAFIEPRAFAYKSPREFCGKVANEVGDRPLLLYRFDDSACIFYLRRTAPVADDAQALGEMLKASPEAYVLSREKDSRTDALRGHEIVSRSEKYRRDLVLLGPGG